MPNRSSLIVPNESPAHQTQAESTPPFLWDTVHQTVLKFANPLCQPPIAVDASSEHLLAAMQRLVAMIKTLRSSSSASLEGPSGQVQPLDLVPYVSEEAYDVLDALHEERSQEEATSQPSAVSTNSLLTPPQSGSKLHPSSLTLLTIDALIPSLLWSLARSSYSAMHLIEGIRAKCWQPGQGWAFGMLRLVVMLEAEAPTVRWGFDLATGYPAEPLLESIAIVQSDELALPIRCASAEASVSDSPCQVGHQLQTMLQRLQTDVPGLEAFLQGVAIELLQPGVDWQTGKLRLQFGFAFSTQIPDDAGSEGASIHPELIDAELMDETTGITPSGTSPPVAPFTQASVGLLTKTHVSVVSPGGRSLNPATLVRLTEADTLEHYTQQLARRQLQQNLVQLQSQQPYNDDESAQLTRIVQAAIASCDYHSSAFGTDLLHPMLLMDELVPKLLWSITSCTYDIMQLVGGLPAQVLQPHATWQQGTLRLLAALHLKAANVDYTLDLSTGRSVDVASLSLGAIVQSIATVCTQPTSVEALITHLQQQLSDAVLEYRLLMDGVSMAWLEDVKQDWQSGTMKLSVKLAFVPDAR